MSVPSPPLTRPRALHVRDVAGVHWVQINDAEPGTAVDQFFDLVRNLAAEDAASGRVTRILADIRGVTNVSSEARTVAYRRAPEVRDIWFAVVGLNAFHRLVVNFMALATRIRTSRYFADEREAMAWLERGPGAEPSP